MKSKFQMRLVLIIFFISSGLVMGLSVFTSIQLRGIVDTVHDDAERRLMSVSRYATSLVTERELTMLQSADDVGTPLFDKIQKRLIEFAYENEVTYVYFMRETEDGLCQYIIDNDLLESAVNLSTPPIPWEAKAYETLRYGTVNVELEVYQEGWEGLISGFAPFFDLEGNIIAVVGVDITDENIVQTRTTLTLLIPLLIVILVIVIVSGLLNLYLHKKVDEERIRALEEAVQANHGKSQFLSNMSHEMRTPLNAIIGMATVGVSAKTMEEKDYSFDKISDASNHLRGVINDILDMSKIEANRLELSEAAFSFVKMLDKAINVNKLKMDELKQEMVVEVDEKIPNDLVGDDQRLTQVITNLISNAVKFTPEGGKIVLTAWLIEKDDSKIGIQISVADNGIGISEEQMQRLFQSFVQADASTSRKYGGTGLGLAISKRIVEMMGGEIWVESEQGKGSVFTFTTYLKQDLMRGERKFGKEEMEEKPGECRRLNGEELNERELDRGELNQRKVESTEGSVKGTKGSEEKDDFSSHTILLAEDVEINREVVRLLLEPTNINIVCAENGKEAVELFEKNPDLYEVIFMDIQMPEMDGFDATKQIRGLGTKEALEVPIIAMTANVFKEDIKSCLEVGMDGHIGKPIDIGEIIKYLWKYLK